MAVGEDFELHVVLVGGDDEAVAAGVGWPAGSKVGAEVAHGGEHEAQIAFFAFFVAGDDVVFGAGDGADAFRQGFPQGGEFSRVVAAPDFVGAVPCAGAVELPSSGARDGVSHRDAADDVGGVVLGRGAAGGEVGGSVKGADAGIEAPVAGAQADFVAALDVAGRRERVDGGDVVEAGQVFREQEVVLVVGGRGAAGGEVVAAVEVGCADVAFVLQVGGYGDFVAGL